ncbi:MAG: Tim44 domain-containing protein [Firmicutes bacterium]|nr:Tim44 domain-containing protein [Bacillota bacterium]
MSKFKKILALVLTLLAIFVTSVNSYCDLGDFNDYDSGGSDWGGSSSWGGSSWDSDSDYSSSGGGGGSLIIAIIIVVLVIIFSKRGGGGSGTNKTQVRQGADIHVPDNTEKIVSAITQYDKNFSNDKFLAWVKETFITLQTAWSERDFEKVRPFEKEELYQQHAKQIQKMKDAGRINVLDRINVNQSYLYKYVRDKEYEQLSVYILARMTDYYIDEKTKAVLQGNPNAEYHLKYIYTFMRKTGVLTDPAKSNNSTVSCPHCGAPTAITSAGKCEYCGFIVTTGEFDWVLSDIVGVKSGVNIGQGGVFDRSGEEAENTQQ